jgi:hypothetical protein
VELFRDVRLDWVEPESRRCDAGEGEDILGQDDLGFAEDWIAEGDIDAKALPVELPRELALGAESEPDVLHAVGLNLGVVLVGADLEGHEVAEIAASNLL